MTHDEIVDMIRRHEGFRDEVYLDTEGVPTCGYGHAFIVGSHIPVEVAERLLWHDTKAAFDDYDTFHFDLDPVRRGVIINMLFNLGRSRFSRFKKTIAALRAKDYDTAAVEMMDSKWARQVKTRAVELSEIMRTGEVE